MLSLATRHQYATLLDAATLREADGRPAILYVASDAAPITITRRTFADATAATAISLHELGLRSGDLVVIAHTQNLESIYAFWGALRLGAVPSMFPTLTEKLDPDVYMGGLAELARLSGVAAVLTTDDFAPALRARLDCPVYGSEEISRKGREGAKDAKRKPDELSEETPRKDTETSRKDGETSRKGREGAKDAKRKPDELSEETPRKDTETSRKDGETSRKGREGAKDARRKPDELSEETSRKDTETSRKGRKDAKSAKEEIDRGMVALPGAAAGEVAFLQHSSGTTGLQKGVALSHAAVLNQVAAYSDAISLREDDVVVSWLPLYHDMGLIAGFLLPLLQGLPLVLMSPFDWVQHPALLFRAIHDHRATLCWLPNFAYNHCARRVRRRDSDGLSAASMRLFVNCSEPVRHDSHALFLERFAANGVRADMLGVSYAMAENTFAVTQTPPGRPARLDTIDEASLTTHGYAKAVAPDHPTAGVRVSCGPPIPGTAVRVLDNAGRPLPDRRVGQIAIRSNCLLSGYYRRPDLNPFTPDGWYLTGDRGYVAAGEVYVVGRAKDLIINAGKNIYPADVESIVNGVPGVLAGRAVVFGVADKREGTELLAVVAETRAAGEDERAAIARAIRAAVAQRAGVTVSYVHLVGPRWLLKTSSGKLARAANRDKWRRETA